MEMEEVQIKQEPADNSDDELDEAIDMEAHLQDMNASDFCARSMKVFTHEKTPRIMNRRKYRGDMNFIQAVARVGQALLDRSQAPEAKQEKRRAAQRVGELLWKECGFQYTVEQVYKKVANLKHRAKLTVERSKHIPPDLKMWLDLLPAEQRARISACRPVDTDDEASCSQQPAQFSEEIPEFLAQVLAAAPAETHTVPPAESQQPTTSAKQCTGEGAASPADSDLQRRVFEGQCALFQQQRHLLDEQDRRQQALFAQQMCMFQAEEARQKELHERRLELLLLKKQLLLNGFNANNKT